MLSWLGNAWRVPELRRRILFTAFILFVYRLGSWLPAPGVDAAAIENYFSGSGGSILGLLNLFSGGALSQFSLFALGIMPYVTASIIVQLMTVAVPKLAELQKEGEAGYAKINQYTRYLTVVLAALQAFGYAVLFQRQDALEANAGRMTLIVVTLTTGTVLLMWLGEQITKRGIGNGISILILASILTSLPLGVSAWWNGGPMERIFFPLVAIGIVASVVFVQEGQTTDPHPVRATHGRPPHDDRRRHLSAAPHSHGRRDPGHLRRRAARLPGDDRAVLPGHAAVHQRPFPARQPHVPPHRGRADHPLHLLLHGGSVQPRRAGGQPAEVRWLHPRHPARARRRRSTSTA